MLGLLEKELRQNAVSLGLVSAVFAAVCGSALFPNRLLSFKGSGLDMVRDVLLIFAPIGGYVIAGNMVGGEFRHRTQLFLEGLPLPRWKMLWVKWTLGMAGMLLVSWMVIGTGFWLGRAHETMTTNFVALLFAKSAGWTCFVWVLNLALAFLGRYRLPCTLMLVLGSLYLHNEVGVLLNQAGPLALLDSRFAYERTVWPVSGLAWTLGLSALLTVLAFWLASVRDASVAAMLAEKMSARERMVFSLLGIGLMAAMAEVSQSRVHRQPVHLPGSVDWEQDGVRVSAAAAVASPTPEEQQCMEHWSSHTGRWLHETAVWLRRDGLPPLYLVHRRDYEKDRLEWVGLDTRQGAMVRLNLTVHAPEDAALQQKLLFAVLEAALHRRLSDRGDAAGWVLDGFAYWWPRRGDPAVETPQTTSAPTPAELAGWMKVREVYGREVAAQIGAVGLEWIAQSAGADLQHDYVAAILGRRVPHHSGALLQEALAPPRRLLRKHTGVEWQTLADGWSLRLQQRHDSTAKPTAP